ncbi:hypothetical protein OUZ56_000876 [Daphnia magna]|uniref:Uncharacterized protein n=1 Tax=Daphnia magna TaxID=35525 RepID=A0ABR0A151_9CRUS|nr:hypothetical protein OUZ56_000876 [Daphnia magna]
MQRQPQKISRCHLSPSKEFWKPSGFSGDWLLMEHVHVRQQRSAVSSAGPKKSGTGSAAIYHPAVLLEKVEEDPIKGACGSNSTLFSLVRHPFWPSSCCHCNYRCDEAR